VLTSGRACGIITLKLHVDTYLVGLARYKQTRSVLREDYGAVAEVRKVGRRNEVCDPPNMIYQGLALTNKLR
jgi:hypothetical protein